jgi:hypothetical protein
MGLSIFRKSRLAFSLARRTKGGRPAGGRKTAAEGHSTRSSFRLLSIAVFVLFVVAGCGGRYASDPAIQATRHLTQATNQLADVLASMRDASSAAAAVPRLQTAAREFVDACEADGTAIAEGKRAETPQDAVDRAVERLDLARNRSIEEFDRVHEINGLTLDFWNDADLPLIDIAIAHANLGKKLHKTTPYDDRPELPKKRELVAQYGHARCVTFRALTRPGEEDLKDAIEAFRKIAPNAQVVFTPSHEFGYFYIAPVDDFDAFVRVLTFGIIGRRYDAARTLVGSINAFSLEKVKKKSASAKDRAAALEKAMANIQPPADTTPKPSDDDYFEKMLGRLQSSDSWQRGDAIKALAAADPARVKNPETKKQIAREFQKIARKHDAWHKEDAIRGLSNWGGGFAVPLLIKMLANADSGEREAILLALGDSKDERALPVLIAMLGEQRTQQTAIKALIQMGVAAEPAVLDVVGSSDAGICIASIEILSRIGTEASLPRLRRALQSKNSVVREKADLANRLIRARLKAEQKREASGKSES